MQAKTGRRPTPNSQLPKGLLLRELGIGNCGLGVYVACALVSCGASAHAQVGHPLVGSWHGDRGTSATNRTDVTLIMDWDGKQLTGLVNPGFEHMALQN